MLIKVTGRFPVKYRGRFPEIGQVLDMQRKHAKLFIAMHCAVPYEAPRPDIPASPSTPISVAVATNLPSDPPALIDADLARVDQDSAHQESLERDAPASQESPPAPAEHKVDAPELDKAEADASKRTRSKQSRREARGE